MSLSEGLTTLRVRSPSVGCEVTVYGSTAARQTFARRALVRRARPRHALGERMLLTAVIVLLLAVCLTLVAAPWAPERAEAAARLFFGTTAPARAADVDLVSREETGPGAHLAGFPVSIVLDRAAAAD